MVSAVHDDDTDYSDLDEEAPSAAPASRHPSGPKNQERLSERTPLLSTSPPPPAYADVTRLYGTPPYVAWNESNSVQPDQVHHQDASTLAYTRTDEPQSMGDPGRDAEDGKRLTKNRNVLTNRKALACLVLILTCSLIGLVTVTTFKHDKNHDSVSLALLVSSQLSELMHNTEQWQWQSFARRRLPSLDEMRLRIRQRPLDFLF